MERQVLGLWPGPPQWSLHLSFLQESPVSLTEFREDGGCADSWGPRGEACHLAAAGTTLPV